MSLIQFIKSKIFLKQVIIAFVGLVVFVFVVMKWLNISTNHDQKIEVPNLEKMSLSEVEKTLKELDLKLFVIDSASYNPEYPNVISTEKIKRWFSRARGEEVTVIGIVCA